MTITWKQFERYWFLFSLGVIIASVPFSKFFISFGQFMIIGGWIVERFDYQKLVRILRPLPATGRALRILPEAIVLLFAGIYSGFKDFSRQKPALIFASVFLLHIIGLIFTTNFEYALKDLRIKFPLLLIPLVLSTSRELSGKEFRNYLLLIILASLTRSVFNTWLIVTHQYIDIRDVSHNVSHIIFSLMLALSLLILVHMLFSDHFRAFWKKILILILVFWFSAYLVISSSFTGISVTVLSLLFLSPWFILRIRNRLIRYATMGIVVISLLFMVVSLRNIVKSYYYVQPVDITKLDMVSPYGNRYVHNYFSNQTENGNRMWLYVQWDEMRESWNRRSKIKFDSADLKGQKISYTLVRFLTSKGWRKDRAAVDQLTGNEIKAIEKGTANYIYLDKFSIKGRIYEFLMGYDQYREDGNPTGSTVMQRFEFWKASAGIIRDNWLTGVGTGDMNEAFALQYERMNTRLDLKQRYRSHNQYLSIFVGFGIIGFIWFLLAIYLPPLMMKKYRDYYVLVVLSIITLAMVAEDTIESQTGITFVTLFYALFLFSRFPRVLTGRTNPDV